MSIRIGGVPYGVGAPLLAGLEEDSEIELICAPPTELIEGLRQRQLAAALVSSIEAVSRPGYGIVDGIGIAAKHEVRSVRAFRRPGVPIRTIGVDTSSATSVALLRILLARVLRAEVAADVEFTRIEPTDRPDQLPQDLVLMIGDCGLAGIPGDREVWDMARLWRSWTGLPFVFAIWVLAPDAPAKLLASRLKRAQALGVTREVADGTHGAVHYQLDREDMRGLRRFWAEARALKLVPAVGEPTIHQPATLREGTSR